MMEHLIPRDWNKNVSGAFQYKKCTLVLKRCSANPSDESSQTPSHWLPLHSVYLSPAEHSPLVQSIYPVKHPWPL